MKQQSPDAGPFSEVLFREGFVTGGLRQDRLRIGAAFHPNAAASHAVPLEGTFISNIRLPAAQSAMLPKLPKADLGHSIEDGGDGQPAVANSSAKPTARHSGIFV